MKLQISDKEIREHFRHASLKRNIILIYQINQENSII
jgi:hypothetical protein